MKMQDNEFDELFRSRLDSFETEPSVDVWEKVDRLAAALLQHGQLVSWNGLKGFLPERDPRICEIAGITSLLSRTP